MSYWSKIGVHMIIGAVVITELILHYINRFKKPDSEHVNEVMFFTDKGFDCKEHCYKRRTCDKKSCSYRNMRCLIKLLEGATTSLDVCIYLLTCQDLSTAMIKVHRKGVRVRVIADAGMADGSGAQIELLRKSGIPVRMKESPYLMHHKFVVINDSIVVTGSCNWTMQGFTGNWENIVITSVPSLVQSFSRHFCQLWKEFSEVHNP